MSSAVQGYFPQRPSPGWKGLAFSRVILATRGPAGRNTPVAGSDLEAPCRMGRQRALHLNSTGTWLPVGLRQGLSARPATAGAVDRQWPSPAGPESSPHSRAEGLAVRAAGLSITWSPSPSPTPQGPPSAASGGVGGGAGWREPHCLGPGESPPCHTDAELLWRASQHRSRWNKSRSSEQR